MSIVVVDDSMTNLVVLKHMAKGNSSLPVHTFTKPEIAVEYLSKNGADLIIVDCEMPGTASSLSLRCGNWLITSTLPLSW